MGGDGKGGESVGMAFPVRWALRPSGNCRSCRGAVEARQAARGLLDCGMTTSKPYAAEQPAREEIDALRGPALLEFGTDWCGFCRAAQPGLAEALAAYPGLRHIKVEDGPGRKLGRSFGVKLWPTLVFLVDGREVERLVRPTAAEAISAALGRQV
jgi:thioredoxin 1